MDTSDPDIIFDEQGICNHCKRQIQLQRNRGYRKGVSERELETIVRLIKHKQRKAEYDVVVGVSGGVDSAFSLHYAVNLGLRVLAVHVDAGWNSEVAVSNIEKLCNGLSVDLHTIVVDWYSMKELQRAFLLSGLPNLDVPQDHVFASAVYRFAKKNKIRFIFNGSNFATEGILPKSWGYDAMDYRFIRSVYKKHGRGMSIKKIPKLSLLEFIYFSSQVKRINVLNYLDYSKSSALKVLNEFYGWNYYGGKHFESRFTKFFQSVYLVQKYGYDKRVAHLSSLVVNKEITRDHAISIIESDVFLEIEAEQELQYILKKTEITDQEWNRIMFSQPNDESFYPNSKKIRSFLINLRMFMRKTIS
jgi:N-acetyl sugar amidotransferase